MDRNLTVLKKMLDEIEFLNFDTKGVTFAAFMADERLKRSVSMTLINIGELIRHLTKEFRKSHSDIPFDDIIGLRDVAAHGYKILRFEFIWETLKRDVPELQMKIEKLLP